MQMRSKVKWYNHLRGYGFILDPNHGPDILVRSGDIIPNGHILMKGDIVEFACVPPNPVPLDSIVEEYGPQAKLVRATGA